MRETLDTPRLLGLLAWAEGEAEKQAAGQPSEWDQTVYLMRYVNGLAPQSRCGTVCCLAGKVVLEDEAPVRWTGSRSVEHGYVTLEFPGEDHDRVYEYARGALGLTHPQATVLFAPDNDLASLRALVAAITEGEGDFERLLDIRNAALGRPLADSDVPF